MTEPTNLPTSPQLAMCRPRLDDLPEPSLPAGYRIRSFRSGDEAGWCTIISESFGGERDFDTAMRADEAFRPERVLFVAHAGELVATASAWHMPKLDPDAGYLHMVGCRPAHAGKRLGAAVSIAAMRQMVREQRLRAVLHTDDFRIPAIKTYLRLGFEPLLVHENQRGRWPAVFDKLGKPELTERFRHILDGPLYAPPPSSQGAST